MCFGRLVQHTECCMTRLDTWPVMCILHLLVQQHTGEQHNRFKKREHTLLGLWLCQVPLVSTPEKAHSQSSKHHQKEHLFSTSHSLTSQPNETCSAETQHAHESSKQHPLQPVWTSGTLLLVYCKCDSFHNFTDGRILGADLPLDLNFTDTLYRISSHACSPFLFEVYAQTKSLFLWVSVLCTTSKWVTC